MELHILPSRSKVDQVHLRSFKIILTHDLTDSCYLIQNSVSLLQNVHQLSPNFCADTSAESKHLTGGTLINVMTRRGSGCFHRLLRCRCCIKTDGGACIWWEKAREAKVSGYCMWWGHVWLGGGGWGGSFAKVSNKTRHLNFLADCRAAATMKTSRDNWLMMKRLHLFIISEKQLQQMRLPCWERKDKLIHYLKIWPLKWLCYN